MISPPMADRIPMVDGRLEGYLSDRGPFRIDEYNVDQSGRIFRGT